MSCPNCGRENAADAAFCASCGTALSTEPETDPTEPAATPPPTEAVPTATPWDGATPAGPPPPARPRWSPLAAWPAALTWAVVAFVALVVLGQVTAFLLASAIEDDPGVQARPLGTTDTVKVGAMYVALANRTAMVAEGDIAGLGDIGGFGGGAASGSVSVKISVALLGFTALALGLLHRGGRAAGERAGGPPWGRALAGATVALPYALLTLILAFFTTFDAPLPAGAGPSGRVEFHPSYVGAFGWPFLLAALAGALGGLRSAREEAPRGWWPRVSAALGGGLRMLLLGLLFAYIGLQVTAFARDDVDIPFGPGYFEQLGELEGLQPVVFTEHVVATIPNQAAWVLVPSMGACDRVDVNAIVFRAKIDFLCYAHFPDQPIERSTPAIGTGGTIAQPQLPEFGSAPPINFLFLLVPLLATMLGGRTAARRAASATRGEGALAGALAGVVYGLLVLLAIVLSRFAVEVGGAVGAFSGTAGASAGPDPVLGTVLALAWGAAGGAIGGVLGVRAAAAGPVTARTEPPPTAPAEAPPPS